jgi:hypothetical protein
VVGPEISAGQSVDEDSRDAQVSNPITANLAAKVITGPRRLRHHDPAHTHQRGDGLLSKVSGMVSVRADQIERQHRDRGPLYRHRQGR